MGRGGRGSDRNHLGVHFFTFYVERIVSGTRQGQPMGWRNRQRSIETAPAYIYNNSREKHARMNSAKWSSRRQIAIASR